MNNNFKLESTRIEVKVINKIKSYYSPLNYDELLIHLSFLNRCSLIMRIADVETMIVFLQNAKKKYFEWKQIAIKNAVKDFSKQIDSYTMEVPCNTNYGKYVNIFVKWNSVFKVSQSGGIYLQNIIKYTNVLHRNRTINCVDEILKELINSKSWIGNDHSDIICNDDYIAQQGRKYKTEFHLTDYPSQLDHHYWICFSSLSFIDELETKVRDAVNIYKEKKSERDYINEKESEEYRKKQEKNARTNNLFK